MNWQFKAKIQNITAMFPSKISYAIYYWLQRNFGELKKINPVNAINSGITLAKKISACDMEIADKIFLEVGTGRRLLIPITLWLLGAKKIITIDINPYLKEELINEDLKFINDNQTIISNLFKSFKIHENRFNDLLHLYNNNWSLKQLFRLCNIEYLSPCDASSIPIPDQSIDYHVSNNVFEHIPAQILKNLLIEGTRVIKKNGIFIHRIDMSDHFAHSDKTISSINFLKYNAKQWNRLAGNKFMYMNRLRVDSIKDVFRDSNHLIIKIEAFIDNNALEILEKKDLVVDGEFSHKTKEDLATTEAYFISKKDIKYLT